MTHIYYIMSFVSVRFRIFVKQYLITVFQIIVSPNEYIYLSSLLHIVIIIIFYLYMIIYSVFKWKTRSLIKCWFISSFYFINCCISILVSNGKLIWVCTEPFYFTIPNFIYVFIFMICQRKPSGTYLIRTSCCWRDGVFQL